MKGTQATMTTTGSQKGNERPVRRDAPSHLFAVGQAVRLKSGFMIATAKAANTYRVTATLPPRGDLPQYRIRNDDELHERVVTQDNLEPVDMSEARANAALIELTFGKNRGTEKQPLPGPKADPEQDDII
jgi:hypothetical protein